MRKPAVFAVGAVVAALLVATVFLYLKVQRTTADVVQLRAEGEQARASYGEAINSIAMIQDSLNAIVLGDSAVGMVPRSLATERALTGPDRDEVLERIAVLKAGIERTKSRIVELDDRLKQSGMRIAGLQRMIAGLKRTVVEKESQVALLSGRVDSLETRVTGLTAEVEQSQETIAAQAQTLEEKRRELGTVYLVVGSKKELTSSGVVVAQGGVLGLGRTLKPSGRLDESVARPLDTDQQTIVSIPAKRAQVLTAQPLSSYQLETAGHEVRLRILDPVRFRTVRHLVILTT